MSHPRAPFALDLEAGRIELIHGGGGRAAARLLEEVFYPAFANPVLERRDDQAVMPWRGGRMAMSTDAHVVSPLFFPGGDIGSLSVHGTVNDVAMSGAHPSSIAAAFILEEGFPLKDLVRVVKSMADAALEAGVCIVTGDTKVVERGKADGMYIVTTGIGVVPPGCELSGRNARPGDAVLVSGYLGDHGVAILSARGQLGFEADVVSDTASLHTLVSSLVASGVALRCLRDPTRGGLAAVLNEVSQQSGVGMVIDERALPVRPAVRSACELLGLEPLHLANEGKLVAVCAAPDAHRALEVMRAHPLGRDAARIGEVIADPLGFVQTRTALGGRRILAWPAGDPLPRIC